MELGECKCRLLSNAERDLTYIHAGVKNSVSYKRLRKYIKFIDYKFVFNLTDEMTLLCGIRFKFFCFYNMVRD
jgi:capsid portal protein